MNRHAFLIMAHQNFEFLKELLLRLDGARSDIYLHVDKKAVDFDPARLEGVLKFSRLFLTERLCVHWGGYSQIACELTLLSAAAKEHYAYYHLLSGSDLPLKSPEEIYAFFDAHAGKEFIAFDQKVSSQARERVALWHFFRESRSPLAEPADHLLTLLQRTLHVDRLCGSDIELRKGPNWFSITDGLAQYVLEREPYIRAKFGHSVCADELFLQTLAVSSPFRAQIFDETGQTGCMANLRYVDWTRGDGNSPYTFTEADRELLAERPELFARKFDKDILAPRAESQAEMSL